MRRAALVGKTLRDTRGATISIGAVTAAMALLVILVYPSYRDSLAGFEIPEAMRGFLGEATDIGSPEGFITAEFFSWIPLLLITLAIIGGTAAFAGEEGAGTLDLLLAQPVKRWRLALEKAVALAVSITLAALTSLIGFAVGKVWIDFELGMGRITAAVFSMLPITFLFLTLSLWASAALPSRSAAATLVTGLVVVSYFLQILGEAAPALQTMRKVSPFYWSEPSRVVIGGFDWLRAVALLLVATAFLALAIWSFEGREIAAVGREWSLRMWSPTRLRRRLGRPPQRPEAAST